MDFDRGDSNWELMLVQRPTGTHLSQSSTPGGKSPLALDDDNKLVTHAVLFDGTKTALVILGAGVALGAAAVKAAPYVKSGLTSLKSKLRRRPEETADIEPPLASRSSRRPGRSSLTSHGCALSDRQTSSRRSGRGRTGARPHGTGIQNS
ncbi:hypothetical protein [Streptomyces sp. NPDC045470]|uniref:hypothetical protein n=1 Tax=unclassified Streptomyces TaxID=2593676 RepID=UPI0033C161FC